MEMTAEQRQEWLQQRRTGIGGSDAAVVLGMSKWKTPLQLYQEKLSSEQSYFDNEPMKWGRVLEPVIRQEYAERTGQTILKTGEELIRSEQHPFMVASLDGFTEDEKVVEIKTARYDFGWGSEGTDEVPTEYLLQVQHYMLVTGFKMTDIAVLIAGSDFRIYHVEADPELHELMIQGEGAFWERVTNQIPPEPVNEGDLLRYFKEKDKAIDATADLAMTHARLKQIKGEIKALEGEEQGLKEQVMGFMGEHNTLNGSDGKALITWKSGKPVKRLDNKQLKKDRPEIYEEYQTESSPIRRFLVK